MRSQGLELFIYSSSRHATKVFAFLFLKKSPLVPLLSKRGSYRSREKNSQIRLQKNSSFLFPSLKKRVRGDLDKLTASYPRIYPSPVWRCRCSSSATLRDSIPPVLFL